MAILIGATRLMGILAPSFLAGGPGRLLMATKLLAVRK